MVAQPSVEARDEETPWLSPYEQAIWRSLLKLQRLLLRGLDQDLLREHQLSLGDYDVMVVLSEADDHQLRMSDLAARLVLSPSGLTRRVDRMVQRGLLYRERAEADARGSFAVITEVGLQQLSAAAPTHVRSVRKRLFDALSEDQIEGLLPALLEVEEIADPE